VKTRAAVVATLIAGCLAIAGGAQQSAVSVAITSPTDGYQTTAAEVTVEGSVTSGAANVSLVILSVNGDAKKVALGSDGGFRATAALERGSNLISAIAVFGNQEVASSKIQVSRQNPVLFFDEFGGRHKRSEWADASGNWATSNGLLVLQQDKWSTEAYTYLTLNDSPNPRDYAVEVDLQNAGNSYSAAVVLRAQDDANKILLFWWANESICWYVVKDSTRSDCINSVSPGLTGESSLRVEARGNEYVAFVNGVKRTSMIDDTFDQGMPGLMVNWSDGIAFDNFKVESLAPGGTPTTSAYTEGPELPSGSAETPESTPTSASASQNSAPDYEPRISQLESQVSQHSQAINSLHSWSNSVDSSLSSMRSTVEQLSAQQSSLSNRLANTVQRVDSLESQPSDLPAGVSQQLANIQSSLSQLEQFEAESQRQLSQNRERIEGLRSEISSVQQTTQYALILGAVGVAAAIIVGVVALQ